MPSEQMQALIDALRGHLPQAGSFTVREHWAMHEALLARRPPGEEAGAAIERIARHLAACLETSGDAAGPAAQPPPPPPSRPLGRAECSHA